jgi:transposase
MPYYSLRLLRNLLPLRGWGAGFTAFQDRLRSLGVPAAQTLVVIEATGSYWLALAVSFHEAGFAVAVVNPAQAHNYALSPPRRAKTDALDAQVLAQFAAERHPLRWRPPRQVYSVRALQYRFLRATGLTHRTVQQIERARYAMILLRQGASIPDTVYQADYFDILIYERDN